MKQEIFEKCYQQEYSASESKGYHYDFGLLRELMVFIKKERRLAFVGGNASYAVLSYTMKITDHVDPFYHDVYFPEMLYGVKGNRRPISPLVIPADMLPIIETFLVKTYGEENISNDGSTYSITLERSVGKQYGVNLYLIRDYSLSFIERLVREKLEGIGIDSADSCWKHIFGRIDAEYTLTDEMRPCLGSAELSEAVSDFIQLSDGVDEYIIKNTDEFCSTFLDGTIVGLINAVSSIKGSHIWDGTEDCASAIGIFNRDAIYCKCVKCLHDKDEAYAIMENVRKGRGLTAKYETILTDAGVSDQFIIALNKIKYVVAERTVLPYVQLILRMAFEKRRNRDRYLEVFSEVLEQKVELQDK